MTAEPMTAAQSAEDETLTCYRHPDREVAVRCGRCDRPICLRCTVEGPVGARCRDCARAVGESLNSFTYRQLQTGSSFRRGADPSSSAFDGAKSVDLPCCGKRESVSCGRTAGR